MVEEIGVEGVQEGSVDLLERHAADAGYHVRPDRVLVGRCRGGLQPGALRLLPLGQVLGDGLTAGVDVGPRVNVGQQLDPGPLRLPFGPVPRVPLLPAPVGHRVAVELDLHRVARAPLDDASPHFDPFLFRRRYSRCACALAQETEQYMTPSVRCWPCTAPPSWRTKGRPQVSLAQLRTTARSAAWLAS